MAYRIMHTGWTDNMKAGGVVDDVTKHDVRTFFREPVLSAEFATFEEARGALKRNFLGENAEHIEPLFRIELDGWVPLVLKTDGGGKRHYLDGRAVQCGSGIELQRLERIEDRESGDYISKPVDAGRIVRYEATATGKGLDVTLFVGVDGHQFASGLEAWMRFRWPKRA